MVAKASTDGDQEIQRLADACSMAMILVGGTVLIGYSSMIAGPMVEELEQASHQSHPRLPGATRGRRPLPATAGPPGAGLDRAVMHRVASATARALLHSVAGELAEPGQGPTGHQEGTGRISTAPVR